MQKFSKDALIWWYTTLERTHRPANWFYSLVHKEQIVKWRPTEEKLSYDVAFSDEEVAKIIFIYKKI